MVTLRRALLLPEVWSLGRTDLVHRCGLTSKQGFVDRQIRGLDEPNIRRYPITLGEEHGVPLDEFAGGNPQSLPLAFNQGARTGQIPQCFQRLLAATLLAEADAHHDENEAEQHQRLLPIAEQHVDGTACHQQKEHRFRGHLPDQAQNATVLGDRQLVGAVADEALAGLGVAESVPVGGWRGFGCRRRHGPAAAVGSG